MATNIKFVFKNKQGTLTVRVPSDDRDEIRNLIKSILKQPPTSGASFDLVDVWGAGYAIDAKEVLYTKLEEV